MSKNFDEEVRAERLTRDNTFVIGGEEFAFRLDFTPEQFSELTADYAAMQIETMKPGEATTIVDETIKGFLYDDENRERWDALRARAGGEEGVENAEDLAVTAYDMRQVILFLIQEQTGRPTEAPSRSGNGRESTGLRSTAPSSSQVVASGG
ncbi:MAG: hypothetical protein K0S82_42 [Gaiellaceae bacterium]|nr:hypothetical protein [Gaiellaceae bacterium]